MFQNITNCKNNDCLKKNKQKKPNKRSVYCNHQPSIINLSFSISNCKITNMIQLDDTYNISDSTQIRRIIMFPPLKKTLLNERKKAKPTAKLKFQLFTPLTHDKIHFRLDIWKTRLAHIRCLEVISTRCILHTFNLAGCNYQNQLLLLIYSSPATIRDCGEFKERLCAQLILFAIYYLCC